MEIESNRDTLIQLATMYYIGNMTQQEIASYFGVTRTKVSRMLKRCRDMKIVEFKINNDVARYNVLEEKIKVAYKLKEVIVTPSGLNYEESKKNVGIEAAKYLNSCLQDNQNIGITWGGTIREMIKAFSSEKSYKNTKVIQLTGGLHSQSTNMDGREMVKVLAIKMHSTFFLLQVPLVVRNPILKKLLISEPEVKTHFEEFKNLDIAFVGLGSSIPEQSSTYKAGYITLEESKKLLDDGFIGDICGVRITKDGKVGDCFLKDRVVGIDLEDLKKVPKVVALACHSDKADSIVSGAKGGFFNTLIIDELAAIAILNKEKYLL